MECCLLLDIVSHKHRKIIVKEESQTTPKNSLNTHFFYFKPSVKLVSAWWEASQQMKKYLPTSSRSFLTYCCICVFCKLFLQLGFALISPCWRAYRIDLLFLWIQYPDSGAPQYAAYYQRNYVSCREECLLCFKMYYTNRQELQLYKASDAQEKKKAIRTLLSRLVTHCCSFSNVKQSVFQH